MKVILAVVLFSCAAVAVNSLVIGVGKCPDIPSFDLDQAKFTGKWNEIKRTDLPSFDGVTCATNDLSFNSNGDLLSRLVGKSASGGVVDIPSVGAKTDQKNVFAVAGGAQAFRPTGLAILDTDYESYAVVFACTPVDATTNIEGGWILGRNSELSADILSKASNVLKGFGISEEALNDVNKNCN